MEWSVVVEESRIRFNYVIDGEPATGTFTRFEGTGSFDRDRPEAARFELRVRTASIDLGDPRFSAFATSAEWFDSKTHPVLTYRLIGLERTGPGAFIATGDLTIRDHTQRYRTPITLDIGMDEARTTGRLQVDRTDYLLGVGPSALFVDIGEEISVSFELVARSAG